ncbi:MAG TPA: mitofilin family membrane protein [Azospirillaceae bacterium]|nr:mitofilin family membrane protein [Azospirillaceae bacterium]
MNARGGGSPSDPHPKPSSDGVDGTENGSDGTASPASVIIERFGGIRPMAGKLDVPVTTVQGWKKRGHIPVARHAELKAAADRLGIPLSDTELAAAAPVEDAGDPQMVHVPHAPGEPVPGSVPTTLSAPPDPEQPRMSDTFPTPSPRPDSEPVTGPAPGSATASEAVRPPRTGRGLAKAALAGSAIAIVTALAVPYYFWSSNGPSGSSVDPAVPDRLAELERRLDQTAAGPAADPGEIRRLGERLAAIEQRPAPASPDLAPIQQRLAALEQRPAEQGGAPDLSAIEQRLGQLEAQDRRDDQETASASDAGIDPVALDRRLAELTQQVQDTAGRLQRMEQQVQGLQQQAQGVQQQAGQLAALQQSLQRLEQAMAAAAQRTDALARTVEQRAEAGGAAQALVLATAQLRSVLGDGRPFQPELQAVQQLAGGQGPLAQVVEPLAPHAATGIPTRAALTERFRTLAGEIIRADQENGNGGDWTDRALGRLGTLVTIRRQGDVEGTGTEAVVARAQAKLGRGDLAGAVDELARLESAEGRTAAAWLADARARLAADRAAEVMTQAAVGRLAGSAQR